MTSAHETGRWSLGSGIIWGIEVVIRFIEKHLAVLKDANPAPPVFDEDVAEGEGPQDWFNAVKDYPHELTCTELKETINRARLLAMAKGRKVSIDDLCITILAWGGMRPANRNRLFERSARPWVEIAEAIRAGAFDRQSAYECFAKLRSRKDSPMKGMGPAYFTKLIYFLMPENQQKGYILDQWAGLSINLISGGALVKMDENVAWKLKRKTPERVVSSRVSDVNTAEDYERFCNVVETLSERLGRAWTPGQAERALMSGSGNKWREYVVAERFGSLPILTTFSDA
ncbi:hypothetical protein HFO86_34655 [Rhizobium leguminosarum]|uniref:8-oxoguanine DNA glycosylase OGG fold protein n=1 Tax=Rhizobium leguminosarum TaxID=384 RepID=UPI001C9515B9|nr:hypothetical protein [Rhizobium leguminosarum]MBY5475287.1 hypothetical protein [Rhizobium leguminosarum]